MPKAVKRNAASGVSGVGSKKTAVGLGVKKASSGVGAKKAIAGAKKSKLYNMPEKLKEGTILTDLNRTEWKIGSSIGVGGFGEIYTASKKAENKYDYVVKCEPHENGPLFVEMHFYMRNAKLEDIRNFQEKHNIKSLGMPYMVGSGSTEINGIKHRFIIMPRYGTDVAKYFLANDRKLPEGTCYRLALQMLDVYEFIHSCGYVHADLKASNILLGYGKHQQHQAYLVDFGLASHYTTKDFKSDPKKMHNGTIEYTSRDAHLGVPTLRADLEILGYNLIEWLGIELPWVRDKLLTMPSKVQKAKENFMSDLSTNLKKLFPQGVPMALYDFLKYVAKMEYNEKPDYEKCRKMFIGALKILKVPLTGDLDFKLKGNSTLFNFPSTSKTIKESTKKQNEKETSTSQVGTESEEEVVNASEDDDDDVLMNHRKKRVKNYTKKSLKTSVKMTPKSERVLANSSLKRNIDDSTNDSGSSPSPSKRTKISGTRSPMRAKTLPTKRNTLKTTPLSSPSSKLRHTPLNAKTNICMSPVVTVSSTRSGKTVINDRITPNRKPVKTYEFNFELDVSMDANVIVNVKRKKKPLQPSQESHNSPIVSTRRTPSEKASSSTPVTRVRVSKIASTNDGLDSPRTPAVTVKKSRRIHHTRS